MSKKTWILCGWVFAAIICCNCNKPASGQNNNPPPPPPPPPAVNEVDFWLTNKDKSVLLAKQSTVLSFGTTANSATTINVDSATTYQTIDGFGYTLTGGSATLIHNLGASARASLLNELFGTGANSIGVSYLRVSIGASDLNASVFSYDDLGPGLTDIPLANFSLSQDTIDLIPLLKEILAIHPGLKILGSPWSPPLWMKSNGNSVGGSLLPQYYSVYAQYFVKYILAMAANGITIDAITPQNEPQYGGNNPSMLMSALEQADFIKNNLGPAFATAGVNTKIIIWDHNCDLASFPITVLNDAGARAYIDGSAFHLYNGDISALSTVHSAYPDKNLYFTEQWTGANESFDGNLNWHTKNVIIGSMRNWSRVALEWNLASDQNFQPHTPGGCSECKGAITITGSVVSRNESYYIIGHASKFVPAGAVRIASGGVTGLSNVAFLRSDGKKVLLVLNEGTGVATFNVRFKSKWFTASLNGGSVGTFIW